jgi:hypothetical protein
MTHAEGAALAVGAPAAHRDRRPAWGSADFSAFTQVATILACVGARLNGVTNAT